MTSIDIAAWLADYHEAWLTQNAEQVAQLFTEEGVYQSHPLRSPLRGRAEIRAYWEQSTRTQAELQVQWGTPLVAGQRVAVEWWATMRETDEGELTLPGCLLLQFAEGGLCTVLREYWHVEIGQRLHPPAAWGT